MFKTLFHIGIVLLAAGIIAGATAVVVQAGVLSRGPVAGLVERGTARQFDRTLVNPPAGGDFSPGAFPVRDFGRGSLQAASLSDILRNLLLISAITAAVLAIRKLLAAAIQLVRRSSIHPH